MSAEEEVTTEQLIEEKQQVHHSVSACTTAQHTCALYCSVGSVTIAFVDGKWADWCWQLHPMSVTKQLVYLSAGVCYTAGGQRRAAAAGTASAGLAQQGAPSGDWGLVAAGGS